MKPQEYFYSEYFLNYLSSEYPSFNQLSETAL